MSNLDFAQIERRLNRLEALVETDDLHDQRLGNASIAKRYNVDVRTITNWRNNPKKCFPAAEIDENGHKFNWLSQLQQYDRLQCGKGD
jgi:hypothetical protein